MISADMSATPAELRLQVFEMDFKSDVRWEAFIDSHPDALIYHHPDWLTALEREYGQKCISLACAGENGEVRGILPLFTTKGLPLKLVRNATGKRLSSLPRTPVAGPLAVADAAVQELTRHAFTGFFRVYGRRCMALEDWIFSSPSGKVAAASAWWPVQYC
jgi:hypothetical protein